MRSICNVSALGYEPSNIQPASKRAAFQIVAVVEMHVYLLNDLFR
jgi:hypothetical protein